jgi:Domain of unknown function (DUF4365)
VGNLDIPHRKERFSVAYVQALAYTAGYTVECIHVDVYGVDLELRDRAMRVDVQMKCTAVPSCGDSIPFDLDSKTYNDLSDPGRIVPAYLFLVEVPEYVSGWIDCTPEGLHIYKCGYYHSMAAEKPTSNSTKKRLHIDRGNRLTVESLDRLMTEARG